MSCLIVIFKTGSLAIKAGEWGMIVYEVKSNTCKQVFRNIKKFNLVFELYPIYEGQAVVCSEVGRNLYPYT